MPFLESNPKATNNILFSMQEMISSKKICLGLSLLPQCIRAEVKATARHSVPPDFFELRKDHDIVSRIKNGKISPLIIKWPHAERT